MKNEIKFTGIAIGYDNNLIYECSDPGVLEEFKYYLDSGELKRVDAVKLWLEIDSRVFYLNVKPEGTENSITPWNVIVNESVEFTFIHIDGRNLMDELEEQLQIHGIITYFSHLYN